MTWQKVTEADVNAGDPDSVDLMGVLSLNLTLVNKDGETYDTGVNGSDSRGVNLGPTEVYEAIEDADDPWVDVDFQGGATYVGEVSDGEPF